VGAGVTTYAYPATERVLYGAGALAGLAEQCDALGARRVAVLTTPSLRGTALLDQVVTGLGPRVAGVLDRSVQHVPLATVSEALAEVRALAPDALVTVGGGSVIDGAKAVAAALGAGFKDAHDLLAHRIELTPAMTLAFEPLPGTPPPQLAVPTTLSAAEYDGIFGMTHEHTKGLYADPGLAPKVVVLDPAATRHTPERLWAASGIRALDHAVEIFLSRSPTPVTDAARCAPSSCSPSTCRARSSPAAATTPTGSPASRRPGCPCSASTTSRSACATGSGTRSAPAAASRTARPRA